MGDCWNGIICSSQNRIKKGMIEGNQKEDEEKDNWERDMKTSRTWHGTVGGWSMTEIDKEEAKTEMRTFSRAILETKLAGLQLN